MNINTDTIIPISLANQNFSKVARLVDQYGSAVIMKNNAPRYIIYEFNQADSMQVASDDDVLTASKELTHNYHSLVPIAADIDLGIGIGNESICHIYVQILVLPLFE